jgi:hypothetical protein
MVCRALPKEAQLEFAHRSLEAQQQPVIDETRVVDAVVVYQHRLVQGAQIDQVVPVTVVARQAELAGAIGQRILSLLPLAVVADL